MGRFCSVNFVDKKETPADSLLSWYETVLLGRDILRLFSWYYL